MTACEISVTGLESWPLPSGCFNPHQICKALKELLGFLLRRAKGFPGGHRTGICLNPPQACPPFLSEGRRLTAPPAGVGHGLSRASRTLPGSSSLARAELAMCACQPWTHLSKQSRRRGEQGTDKHGLTMPCFPAGLGWAGLGWGRTRGTHRQAAQRAASQGMA